MFWHRQHLNISIKRAAGVCGLPFARFDIPVASFPVQCRGSPNPREMNSLAVCTPTAPHRAPSEVLQAPRATPEIPFGIGNLSVTARAGLGWAATSPAPGQPKPLSPHLCKPAVYFYLLFPSLLDPLECPGCQFISDFTSDVTKRLTLICCCREPALLVCSSQDRLQLLPSFGFVSPVGTSTNSPKISFPVD